MRTLSTLSATWAMNKRPLPPPSPSPSSLLLPNAKPLYQLTRMKFQDPHDGEQAIISNYKALSEDIVNAFRNLGDE
jgi:hypothetical protein